MRDAVFQGTFICITEAPRLDPKLKTKHWIIETKDGQELLGDVLYHTGWRRYVFYPMGDTCYEPVCLGEISLFLREQTDLLRSTWKKS